MQGITASDRHAVGVYQMRASHAGRTTSWLHMNIYLIQNCQIVEVWQHPLEQDVVDAFPSEAVLHVGGDAWAFGESWAG